MARIEAKPMAFALVILALAFLVSIATSTGFATATDHAGVLPDSSAHSATGYYETRLTVNLDTEYNSVTGIEIKGVPGGESCGAAIKAEFYDASGVKIGTITTGRVGQHSTATKSVQDFAAKSKMKNLDGTVSIKKIIAYPVGDDNTFTADCRYIDKFDAYLTYNAPIIGKWLEQTDVVNGVQMVVAGKQSRIAIQTIPTRTKLDKINVIVDGATMKTCSDTTWCNYDFTEKADAVGKTRNYRIEAKPYSGNAVVTSGKYAVYGKMTVKATEDETGAKILDFGKDVKSATLVLNVEASQGGCDGIRVTAKFLDSTGGQMSIGQFYVASGSSERKAYQLFKVKRVRAISEAYDFLVGGPGSPIYTIVSDPHCGAVRNTIAKISADAYYLDAS